MAQAIFADLITSRAFTGTRRAQTGPTRGVRRVAASVSAWVRCNARLAFAGEATPSPTTRQLPDALRGLIRNTHVALVTTRDAHGKLYTRPMEASTREFDGELWFTASDSAPIIGHICARPAVQVTYVDECSNRCLVLDGIARVFRGADLRGAPWRAQVAAWFAATKGEPSEAFIRIDVMSADVWE